MTYYVRIKYSSRHDQIFDVKYILARILLLWCGEIKCAKIWRHVDTKFELV